MHRITVVTSSSSAEPPSTPIPLPNLDALSDESSRDTGSPGSSPDIHNTQKPIKVSNWRKRGSRHLPPPYPDPIPLDLSLIKRRDLPIKLVVDEPVPVESYSDDPFSQSSSSSLVRRPPSGRFGSSRRSDKTAAKMFANFDDAFSKSCSTESSWVPFDQASRAETATSTTGKESPSVEDDGGDSLHVFEDTEQPMQRPPLAPASPAHAKDRNRPSSTNSINNNNNMAPVALVRMEYQGEMVSVSEKAAARLQECSWV